MVETLASVVASGAGVAIGGTAGAILPAGTSPALAEGVNRFVDGVVAWRRRRAGEVYADAAAEAGLGDLEFADRLVADERLAELAGRVFLVAQDASLSEKRAALASVLSAAARGPDAALVDHALLLLPAIEAIDRVHIRFMASLESAQRRPETAGDEGSYGMRLAEVLNRDPGLGDVGLPVLQTLIGLGLVENATGGMTFMDIAKSYALSSLGDELLSLLRS